MKRKIIYSLVILVSACMFSCYFSMDDVSVNPNKPTEVHPKSILVTLSINTFGIDFYGIQPHRTAWQWDGRSGGGTLNFLRRGWAGEYRRIGFINEMIGEAERVGDERYVHLAAFFRAYWFFNITRLYGDVPYTEGGAGRTEGMFTPVYDNQEDIIFGLLQELEAANGALARYENTKLDGDIIYGGDVKKWRKLINMYRLRILMNCSMKTTIKGQNVSQMFADIVADPAANPLMESFEDSAILDESGRQGTYIYYNDNNFVSSYRLTKFIVEFMKDRGDMRLTKIGEPMIKISDPTEAQRNDLANYAGVLPNPGPTDDTNNTSSMAKQEQSCINAVWHTSMIGPSHMMTGYAEQEFILAEAILRGWLTGDMKKHYENGITAAYKFLGMTTAQINAYLGNEKVKLADSDTPTQKLKKIITEKYMSFFLNGGFESYFELRRTGYPDFNEYLDHQYTTYIYNDGYLPLRYQYPNDEVTRNNKNMTEAVKRLEKGDDRNSRMWLLQGTDPLFNPSPFPFRN